MATLNQESQSRYFSFPANNYLGCVLHFAGLHTPSHVILLLHGFLQHPPRPIGNPTPLPHFLHDHFSPLPTLPLSLSQIQMPSLRIAPFSKQVLSLSGFVSFTRNGNGSLLLRRVQFTCHSQFHDVRSCLYSRLFSDSSPSCGFPSRTAPHIYSVCVLRAFYLYGVLGALLMCLFNSLLAVVNIVLE
ncbi:hypothetical protein LguiA_003282 [Lonicera macranthoides]